MARLERFERPTAWFVARYSIQLSYRRLRVANYPYITHLCQEIDQDILVIYEIKYVSFTGESRLLCGASLVEDCRIFS